MTISPRPYTYISYVGCSWLIIETKGDSHFFPRPRGAYINADNTIITIRSATKTVRLPADDIIGASSV